MSNSYPHEALKIYEDIKYPLHSPSLQAEHPSSSLIIYSIARPQTRLFLLSFHVYFIAHLYLTHNGISLQSMKYLIYSMTSREYGGFFTAWSK